MHSDPHRKAPGHTLETLSWPVAANLLTTDTVVVIPLGAAAKEHGPHLPLNTDALIAEWLAEQVRQRLPVVVAPLINTSFYPAFADYPGSISLPADTARDMVIDICLSLARHGAKKFYVLNTGVSTQQPLAMAKAQLAAAHIQLDYLCLADALNRLDDSTFQQQYGSHADEHETSLMLHIAEQVVDMSKAVDDGSEGKGALSRTRGEGTWSASGVYGQPTLASAGKGEQVADALLQTTLAEIEKLLAR